MNKLKKYLVLSSLSLSGLSPVVFAEDTSLENIQIKDEHIERLITEIEDQL